jgi:hypothetical protein
MITMLAPQEIEARDHLRHPAPANTPNDCYAGDHRA